VHVESFENCGGEGLPGKTVGAEGCDSLTVDNDADELGCREVIGALIFFRQPGLNFVRSLNSILWVHQRHVIDVQKHQNTITAEIVDWVALRQGGF